jgi:hypothetical protein
MPDEMKAQNLAELKSWLRQVDGNIGDESAPEGRVYGQTVTQPEPEQMREVVAQQTTNRDDELLLAIRSLEQAVRGDESKDIELLDAVRGLEGALRSHKEWVFTVERGYEGITKIIARTQ